MAKISIPQAKHGGAGKVTESITATHPVWKKKTLGRIVRRRVQAKT